MPQPPQCTTDNADSDSNSEGGGEDEGESEGWCTRADPRIVTLEGTGKDVGSYVSVRTPR